MKEKMNESDSGRWRGSERESGNESENGRENEKGIGTVGGKLLSDLHQTSLPVYENDARHLETEFVFLS